jgi:diguanylate cyclase (GGDEF)-like protein
MRVEVLSRLMPDRRIVTPGLVGSLGLFALCAAFFCIFVASILLQQADESRQIERRAALHGAIEAIRSAGIDFSELEPARVRDIERIAGLKDLRFEAAPSEAGRELQSVLSPQGRIVGWFSWEPDRSLARALLPLKPLLVGTSVLLIGFAGFAIWQVRRVLRDLAASERKAWTLAHEDLLTGLPNHRKMLELIDAALAARAEGGTVTLALIDIDGMKDVNDALGRRAGDELLMAFAARLKDKLPERAVGGRFDGNEFAVMVQGLDAQAAGSAVDGLIEALARPYWAGDQTLQVGATAGLAHAPGDGTSRDEMTRRANLALRAAKRKRRNGAVRFEPAMDAEFEERRFLERELKRALINGDLDVHYQPIVGAAGAQIVGAEALLRWRHAERGAIAPDVFVAAAERSGLIGELGEFVLRRALNDGARWPDLYVAVNLSPLQVRDAGLTRTVERCWPRPKQGRTGSCSKSPKGCWWTTRTRPRCGSIRCVGSASAWRWTISGPAIPA